MEFCDECGSMMRADGDSWRCRSCGEEQARDPSNDAAVTVSESQQDDGRPDVAGTDDTVGEIVEQACPADGCDSERASYEMMPKPGGSYQVRLFTCVECGHTWRDT